MEGKQTNIYRIEIAEGDEMFVGSDIPASSEQEAIDKMMFMFAGQINQYSQVLHIEEHKVH